MFTDLRKYFFENVLVTYQDYLKIRNSSNIGKSHDLKTNINLANALYHLREHLPQGQQKTLKEYITICPDYAVIRDVVNLSKHKTITRYNPRISDINNLFELVIHTLYEDKNGEYWNIGKSVYAKLDDGTERDFFEIITNVLNMWLVELEQNGIIEHINPFSISNNKIPKRSRKSDQLKITMIRGLPFNHRVKYQKYNYAKGVIEPIDLTGKTAEFRIFKPKYTLKIEIKDNKGGEEKSFEIKVDEDQLRKFKRIKTSEKKIQFFFQLAREQGVIS